MKSTVKLNMLKIYLPIYLLLYLLIAFVVPTYRTFKKTGINPITFGKNDNGKAFIVKFHISHSSSSHLIDGNECLIALHADDGSP